MGATSRNNCTACDANTYSTVIAAVSTVTCQPCASLEGAVEGSAECWPGMVSAVASNPPPVVIGFSSGDVVTITFTRAVQVPSDTLTHVTFTPSIGTPVMSWQFGECSTRNHVTALLCRCSPA